MQCLFKSSDCHKIKDERDVLIVTLRNLCERFREIEPELNGQTAFCANHGLMWRGPSLENPLKAAETLLKGTSDDS